MPDAKETLLYVLGSEEFFTFYQKYIAAPVDQKNTTRQGENDSLPGNEGVKGERVDLLAGYLEKIKTPECHVAVLGIQGAGKSSLLNALIFGEEILPVEVEETTCIPTLIRRVYPGETPGAEIHYQDGHVEQIPLKREFLEKIVDNRYNPGNLIAAASVTCRSNATLLQEGFVFVDLPGVGSLTEKNEATTVNFLRQTHIGIFLLRTVPPITQSESGFIRIAWPMVQQSLFVQNLWAKETETELREGMEHNQSVLAQIAAEQQTKPPKNITAVNVALACQGTYSNDKAKIAESGLDDLKATLRKYAQFSLLKLFYFQTADFFSRLIQRSQQRIKERMILLKSDQAQIAQRFKAEKDKYLHNKEDLEKQVAGHLENFLEKISTVKMEWLPARLEKANDGIMEKLDKEPLEHLKEDDFRQAIRQICSTVFGVVYSELQIELARVSESYIENLSNTLQDMASLGKVLPEEMYKEKSKDPKAAKGWSIVLTGSLAPVLGYAGLVAGPAGWTIFGGAVLAGSLVRWISGATAHQRIMRGVRKAVGDLRLQIRKEMTTEIDNFALKVTEAIRATVQSELLAYEAELQRIDKDLKEQLSNQMESQVRLEADFKQAEVFLKTLTYVSAQ